MAADLREHPRFTSQLNALLTLSDGRKFDCIVTDFSHSGMKLNWQHGSLKGTAGVHQLQLSLANPVNIAVEWVFQRNQVVGIKLHEPDDQLFLQLQEVNQSSRAGGGITSEQRETFKKLFVSEASRLIERLPRQWLPEFLEGTFDQANQARNTAEQQQWLKLEKQVKAQGDKFFQRFSQILTHQLKRWMDGEAKISDESEDYEGSIALSLVHQSDFEDWLLAKVTASHLQSHLNKESFELRQLLDTISSAPVENCFNPIGPNTVTEAFRDSVETIGLPHEARELAFDTFEHAALTLLTSTYQNVIRQINIPLTFRYRKPKQDERPQAATTASYAQTEQPTAGTANSVKEPQAPKNQYSAGNTDSASNKPSMADFQRHHEEARQAYENIQHLLSLRYQRSQPESEAPALPEAAPEQITDLVAVMSQVNALPDSHVLDELEHELARQDVSLPEDTRHAIDTIEHVTRDLLDNPQIADFIKPSISQLGWPLLHLMLNDATLLFNQDHPGRLVLNLLARLGHLTTTGQGKIQATLEELITPLTDDIQNNPQQLDELLESLQTMVGSAERKARKNAERVAQTAEGEYRLAMARRRIDALIGRDISGRTLPNCVVEWLREGWQQMLCLLLLREGPDSVRFKGAVKLYRQTLVLFNSNNTGRRELMLKFAPMMDLARQELDQLNGPLPRHDTWHKAILEAAEEHLSHGEVRETVDLPEFIEEQEDQQLQGKGARRARNLQMGDRLLIISNNQTVSIAWIAADMSRFACVNHSGMKIVDFTFNELAIALEDGSIKRLYEAEESAVDQSVDSLVQQIYKDLSEQANIDALTGLTNRQHFLYLLQEQLQQHLHSGVPQTLCMIDIDQFKLINKNYGVEGGDICLQAIATLIEDHDGDAICARIGSNEFAVLFPRHDIEQAEASTRLLRKAIEQFDIPTGESTFRVHVSMGLAELNADTTEAALLFEQAESACMLAKDRGGSRIVRYEFDDASRQRQDAFMHWGNKLNQALENEQLSVLCVPIKAIQERHKGHIQYEVVISIADEDGAQIPPLEYLQAAENYNRMYMLDRWIIEQMVQWLADNPETAATIQRFVLRLSGHAINDESLLAYIFEQAREKDVPVNKLCFELNETSAIKDLDDAADFMHEMRSLGCKFVLADFGTGQSSFRYLKALPVDFVKIDHNFIDGLNSSSADYALIKSIQEIAQFMAKKTIAEYSPNQSVWEILRGIGIDYSVASSDDHIALQDLA